MKKFNLGAAKDGAKVVTRDGRAVRIICFDALSKNPIKALVKTERGTEELIGYRLDGVYYEGDQSIYDLFLAPIKKEGWMNVYPDFRNTVYATKAEADKEAVFNRISCVKVEWEE